MLPHPLAEEQPSSQQQRYSMTSSGLMSRDAVSVFLRDKQFPTKQRKTMSEVPLNFQGVLTLSENECWDAVRATCERCLQLGFTPHENLQYRLGFILAQFRLHNYESANKVLDSLGDLHNSGNYFYESYPQIYNKNTQFGERKGNMVPWTMLFLKAIMPHFDQSAALLKFGNLPPVPQTASSQSPQTQPSENDSVTQLNSHANTQSNGTQVALDRLYRLLNMCRKVNLQQRFDVQCTPEEWFLREQRVIMMIVNCHICKKEYYLALGLLEPIIQKLEEKSSESAEALETYVTFRSLQGCLHLQSGMIPHAEKIYLTVKQVANQESANQRIRCSLNEGFLLFAKGKFAEACKEFGNVLKEDPDHVFAANNQAICLLHMCQLSKAIDVLEEVIR